MSPQKPCPQAMRIVSLLLLINFRRRSSQAVYRIGVDKTKGGMMRGTLPLIIPPSVLETPSLTVGLLPRARLHRRRGVRVVAGVRVGGRGHGAAARAASSA